MVDVTLTMNVPVARDVRKHLALEALRGGAGAPYLKSLVTALDKKIREAGATPVSVTVLSEKAKGTEE